MPSSAVVSRRPAAPARAVWSGRDVQAVPPGGLKVFSNQASTNVLAGGQGAPGQGTLEVWTVANPSVFPSASQGTTPATHFDVADPQNPPEIIKVIWTWGATWLVVRGGVGQTTPVAHAPGFSVQIIQSAGFLNSVPQASGGVLTLYGALTTAPFTLADAATVAVNAALTNFFRLTVGGNRTLGTPSNPTDTQTITVEVIQPASGGPWTLGFSAAYSFPASCPQPSLSTAASSRDLLYFTYDAGVSLWVCTGYILAQNGGLVTIAQGGTGQATAAAAYNALSPMLVLGDLEYESGANTAARLPGNTAAQKMFLSQAGNGTVSAPPAWSAVSGQYLCAPTTYAPAGQAFLTTQVPTTVAAGSNGGQISLIASWATPSAGVLSVASTTGFASSGTLNVATSTTVATITYTGIGGNTFTGCAYVSGSATGTVATGGAVGNGLLAAFSSANINTGAFTAPASGSVIVSVSVAAQISAVASNGILGLVLHGTTTPAGNLVCFTDGNIGETRPYSVQFLVTGLTSGTSYTFDLAGAVGAGLGTISVVALGVTVVGATKGAPATMIVQAV